MATTSSTPLTQRLARVRLRTEPLGFVLASCALAWPLWAVERPALEDFPQHVAITALLYGYDTPELGFARDHVIDWSRSPHVLWYALSHVLAFVVGPLAAAKTVMTASLVGLPLAFRFLLTRAERPVALSWLALGLVWTGFAAYGFAQFIAGVAPMCVALGLGADARRPSGRAQLGLALSLVACFGMHVLCAAIAFFGVVALRVAREGRHAWRSCLGVLAAGVVCAVWLFSTDAGVDLLAMAGLAPARELAPPDWLAVVDILPDATRWLSNVTQGGVDDRLFLAWVSALVFATLVGQSGAGRLRGAWLVIVGVVWVGTLVLPATVGWIWPLNARLAWLAILLGLVLIPAPRGLARTLWVVVCGALALGRVAIVSDALGKVATIEQAGLTDAIAAVPRGARLCGVMHDSHSSYMPFWPHHHAAAWVQAERGGSLVFSFVDHPSTPVRWRDDATRPTTGPTGFRPGQFDPADLDWCERVLVLNGPGAFETSRDFEPVAHDGPWSVWAPSRSAQR
ncbi:MAG: hypothetical protein H6723_09010 [Sandaracinus sp.]|nr:hypothetical protein [Sandaracinus sp.]